MLGYDYMNKQYRNVIDYDSIESNHNRDYICFETFSETKPICMISHKLIFRQHTIWMNAINEITNL